MASRIPEPIVEEVLARSSILDVIGQYVRLQKRGSRWLGLCPFHDEKTPSFSVNGDRGLFYCFGCQASGNTVQFLMKHDGLSFPEAIRRLAERVNVEIPEGDAVDVAEARRQRAEREHYDTAMRFALQFYVDELWSGRYPEPLDYLKRRGIDRETAEQFQLGFAPAGWSALVDAAGRAGVQAASLDLAGLALARNRGEGHYDRFRNRVMFPVIDLSRRPLAFSGRTLDPEERAKYVNSPETRWYTKGRELFGLHAAHKAIREAGSAVLVEGNFDVVSLHARGLTNVCAALGTAITERQARLLRRFTDRVVLCFDGDRAGRAAARKALDVLLGIDMPEILLAELPDGTDPDDYVQTEGVDALRSLIDDARPMLAVCVDRAIAPAVGAYTDATARRSAIDAIGDLLEGVTNKLVWTSVVDDVCARLGMQRPAVERYLRERRRDQPPRRDTGPRGDAGHRGDGPPLHGGRPEDTPVPEPRAAVRHLSPPERALVELLAADSSFLATVHREQIRYVVEHAELSAFIGETAERWVQEGRPDWMQAIDRLPATDALRSELLRVLASDTDWPAERLPVAFAETLTTLKRVWLQRELRRLEARLRTLEAEGRFDEARPLYERHQQLIDFQRNLDTPEPAVR